MELSAYFTEKHEYNCGRKGIYSEYSVSKVLAWHCSLRAFWVQKNEQVEHIACTHSKDSLYCYLHTHISIVFTQKPSHLFYPSKDLKNPEDLLEKNVSIIAPLKHKKYLKAKTEHVTY